MHEIETVNVKLENLKPFSGVLYDKNNVAIRFEGNPFYVPQDYLPATSAEAEEADADESDEATEAAAKEKPSEPVASLRRLHASIEAEGLLTPILVRPAKTENPEEYEILSGYRRKRVCEELAKTNPDFVAIPAIVIDCDDDTASSIITSSNVQRQALSLLDKIKSCGRMYRAMAHRGKAKQEGEEYTRQIVSNVTGIKPRTVVRYAALMSLPEDLLELAGNKVKNSTGDIRFSIRAGETLSTVGKNKLAVISRVLIENKNAVLTNKQAGDLKKFCKDHAEITDGEVKKYLNIAPLEKKESKPQTYRIEFNNEKMQALCPDMSKEDVENLVYEHLEKWKEAGGNKP